MKKYLSTLSLLALGLLGVLAPNAKADEWNKRTNITISQSIEVEGTVLPAGSYVLELTNLPSARNLVRISNADSNRLITTVYAIRAYRLVPADNSEFKFYESGAGRPPALHTWFYPGDPAGFEFTLKPGVPTVEAARGVSETPAAGSDN
jgi:hypothetical protein